MNISAISFTKKGVELSLLVRELLEQNGSYRVDCYTVNRLLTPEFEKKGVLEAKKPLGAFAGSQFRTKDGLIFIGAVGIAVRLLAPFIKDKKTDPAVIVMDEQARFVIPILSGHEGGANDLALEVSRILPSEAVPVLTTASDVNSTLAPDLYAKSQGLIIDSWTQAKVIAAAALEGEKIGFFDDFHSFPVPKGCIAGKAFTKNIWITARKSPAGEGTLKLIRPCVFLGMGCRKGAAFEDVKAQALEALKEADISRKAVKAMASIEIKKEEEGLLKLAEQWKVPFLTYSAKELMEAKGDFSSSAFVARTTGVDNVCERSAVLAGGGPLILTKRSGRGITAALAVDNGLETEAFCGKIPDWKDIIV